MKNGTDFSGATLPSSFSTYLPMDLTAPFGAYQSTDAGKAVVVFVYGDNEGQLVLHGLSDEALLETIDVPTTVAAAGDHVSVRPVLFPGAQAHFVISNGSDIQHTLASGGDVRPIPPPMGMPTWNNALVTSTYSFNAGTSTQQIAVVSSATDIQRSPLPDPVVTMFNWTAARTGPPWAGVTAFDLVGTGEHEEILGYDVPGHMLCAQDPAQAAPLCISTGSTFPGTDVRIVAGRLLPDNMVPDVLVIASDGTTGMATLLADATFTGTTFTATARPSIAVDPIAFTALVDTGSGTPAFVYGFTRAGKPSCLLGPGC
jgi:hypothetical protein